MPRMHLLPLPAFDDNYIWTWRDDAGRALVVDPGDAAPVLAAGAQGLQPIGVLLTHHHGDHIDGVAAMRRRWPDLPVIAPHEPRIPIASERVGDGDRVRIGDWAFDTIAVPGHTVSHIAFHGHGLLFCGDTLFSLGCGRLFEGTPAQMVASLTTLSALPDATRVCCGHEYTLSNAKFARMVDPDNEALARRAEEVQAMRDAGHPSLPSTLAIERATNPFLRIEDVAVRAAIAAYAKRAIEDRADAFAILREWKDGFSA